MTRMRTKAGAKKFVPVLAVILAALTSQCPAVADMLEEYTVKAALTLNLARFTQWPADVLGGGNAGVTICSLGDNVVQDAFSGIEKKTIGGQPVKVINLTRLRDLNHCHLLFVSGLEKNKIVQLIKETNKTPLLTIGEDNDFLASGGMVMLKIVDGKVNIQINLDAVQAAGLQINSRVLKLATIVSP